MAMYVRFEWIDGNTNRFYASCWNDVQDVLDDMGDMNRQTLTAVVWPDEEEDGATQCKQCGAIFWSARNTPCPQCGNGGM